MSAAGSTSARDGDRAEGPAPSRRPRARRGEGELLRDEILDAAEALLEEHGDADKVSIRMVAERVGRTSPSVYLHFDDKASLMMAVCERQFASYDVALQTEIAGLDDPIDVFRGLGRSFVRFAIDHPEEFRILFLSDRSSSGGWASLDDFARSPAYEAAAAMLERGAAEGRFRDDVDPMMVTITMWGLFQGIASLLVTTSITDWPEPDLWIESAIALQLEGLLVR